MTVSSISPVNNYTGNNSATNFDFDFLIENQEELVVSHIDKDGITRVLQFGIDYSINEIGNKNGSYITFPLNNSEFDVLSTDETISLALSLPIKQESEFENSSNLNLNVLEKTFDYIVRILQVLNRQIERSVKITEGSSLTPDSMISQLNENVEMAAQAAIESKSSEDSVRAMFTEVQQALVDLEEEGKAVLQSIKDVGFFMQEGKLFYYNEQGNPVEYPVTQSALDLKANVSFNNVQPVQTFIDTALNWMCPDYSKMQEIELVAAGEVSFECPSAGVVFGNFNYSTAVRKVKINDFTYLQGNLSSGTSSKSFFLIVSAGDVVTIGTYTLAANVYAAFAPLKGVQA